MNSRLKTSRTGRIWTEGAFAAPRQYGSNRVNTIAWFENHVARVNGPLPHSPPPAGNEFGTPHRTPPFLPTHDSDKMEPKVEARIGRTAGYGRRRWTTTERPEEHTSELQSRFYLVCRLLLEITKT